MELEISTHQDSSAGLVVALHLEDEVIRIQIAAAAIPHVALQRVEQRTERWGMS